jgi:hypothetical protein
VGLPTTRCKSGLDEPLKVAANWILIRPYCDGQARIHDRDARSWIAMFSFSRTACG